MADDKAQADAAKQQKVFEAHNKEFDDCNKQLDKLDAVFKKALKASKTIDKLLK